MKQLISCLFLWFLIVSAWSDEAYRKVRFLSSPSGASVTLAGERLGRTGDFIPIPRQIFQGANERNFTLTLPGHRPVNVALQWGQLQEGKDLTDPNGRPWNLEAESYYYWILDHLTLICGILLGPAAIGLAVYLYSVRKSRAASAQLAQATQIQEEVKVGLQNIQLHQENLEKEHPWTGQTIGDYRALEFLGKGAFGEVYRGERLKGHGPDHVAIKICSLPPGEPLETYRARLSREFSSASRIRAPEIIGYYDWGQLPGNNHFFILELVENGETLTHWMEHNPDQHIHFLELLVVIAQGLQKLHNANTFHRDLKPDNILLNQQGHPKIADFGLALDQNRSRMTAMDQTLGTMAYMAPEAISPGLILGPEENITNFAAVDQYALAVIACEYFEAIPNSIPATTAQRTRDLDLVARLYSPPVPLKKFGPKANACLLKMLSPHPKDRHTDIVTAFSDLKACYLEDGGQSRS